MKKKLVLGLGLIAVLFILSGIFIIINLNIIISSEELKSRQEKILDRYGSIQNNIKSAQAELYRHQAGYSRDIDSLVEYVLGLEDMISLTKKDYSASLTKVACNHCHSAKGKVETLNKAFDEVDSLLKQYKEKISLIVTSTDVKLTDPLEKEAAKEGDEIVNIVGEIRHATLKMNRQMEETQTASINKSRYSILTAIILTILFSSGILIIVIKSVTRQVDVLVKGVERVSGGDYSSKVPIASKDEIGFLAKTFNTMTENLNAVTCQKEILLAELQKLNNDLEQRIHEAKEELRMTHEMMLRSETLAAVGTFASGVAHELATPLSSVIGYFQMVKNRMPIPENLKSDCALIENELLRFKNILGSMLNFARKPGQERMPTDINAMIHDLLTLIRYQTEYKNIRIDEDLSPDMPDIMAVPGQMRQVFMNIIVNALQSMPDGGELKVSTFSEKAGNKIATVISDTGCGIMDNDKDKIFQAFYTTKKAGTGLGLSISHGVIKAHGGDIEVESEPGKGTTFYVYLPVEDSIVHKI